MEEKERLEFVRALFQTAVLDSRRESEGLVTGDCSPARTILFVADFEGSHVLGGPDGTPLEARPSVFDLGEQFVRIDKHSCFGGW